MGRRATLTRVTALACTAPFVALAACADTELELVLELPPHDDAATLIVGLEAPRTLALHARARGSTRPVVFDTHAVGPDARLWALLYREPLDALGLEEGLLVESDGGRGLPAELRRLAAPLSTTSPLLPMWTDAPARSAALDAFTIPLPPTKCPQLELDLRNVPSRAQKSSAFLEKLDEAHVLIGLEDGALFLLDQTGAATPLTVDGELSVRSAFADGADVWLGGVGGRIARASLAGTALVVATSTALPTDSQVRDLHVEHTPAGVEVRAMSQDGELFTWTDAGARLLHTFGPPPPRTDPKGGIASIAPGEWVATQEYSQDVVRVRGGVVTTELLPPVGAPRRIVHSAAIGTIVGTTDGVFLRHDGRAWELIPGSPLTVYASSLAVSGPGFFYGGAYGNLGYWSPTTGYCPLIREVDFHVEQLAIVGDSIFASGQNQDSDYTPFAIFRRR
ncbi:hypothetical protein L6R52_15125 [Myxococcota bacterium]|nr:hypothetical protein [Myxococcota bacterium]